MKICSLGILNYSIILILIFLNVFNTSSCTAKEKRLGLQPRVIQPGEKEESPADIIVLSNGENLSNFVSVPTGDPMEKKVSGKKNTVVPGKKGICTKQNFGDCQLHKERKTPPKDTGQGKTNEKPNVILIMADDMGYECLSCYGSVSYSTPVLDNLASQGIRFSNCVSQPLCTPSRVKIMTGQYNYRNYTHFGHLGSDQYTFGNLMKDAGYATCIAGKWQLNGLAYKDQFSNWNDNKRPHQFGFDEYCLWQLTMRKSEGERFSSPVIEQNGEAMKLTEDDYGPDVFSNYILDFIERKKDEQFFVYYPMVLVHDPFVPTPDSDTWADKSISYKNDTTYFKDMVAYTDKIVGKIENKLKELKIDENTIIIFTGDNGTHYSIYSKMVDGTIRGGKGNTTDAGTHVPLVISWPKNNKGGKVIDELIEFSDFFSTFVEIVGANIKSDGKSFLPLISNQQFQPRETAFVNYDPRLEWANQYRNQFIRTTDYKLYQDGKFYNLNNDILEQTPISSGSLSENEFSIRQSLENELKKHPKFK